MRTNIQDEAGNSAAQSIAVTFNGGDGNDVAYIEGGDSATIFDGNGNDTVYTQADNDTLNFNITAATARTLY